LIHLDRVAREIRTVGLYDLVLQDVQKIAGKNRVSETEILDILGSHPQLLQDYMQTNVEYNLSNIHLRDIETGDLKDECIKTAEKINTNLAQLRELEKYTLDFEQSAILVIIFSIEFFVLFSVQYFIVLLNLKAWQGLIYGIFASSVAVAYWYGKKEQKKFARNKAIYEKMYEETLEMVSHLEKEGCIRKSDLLIEECDEHV